MKQSPLNVPVVLLVMLLLFSIHCSATDKTPHTKIKYYHKSLLKNIPEPSDMIYDEASAHLFIVSDHGKLFECDTNGAIIAKAEKTGFDFEGIESKDGFLFVADETTRKVYKYTKAGMLFEQMYTIVWGGAANKAYESIAWNPEKGCFLMISEQPAVIVEYNEKFTEINRQHFYHTRDISSARYYNGFMYLLSDLEHCLIKCNAKTYEPIEYYTFDILNPEGFAFGPNGKLYIISDNAQKLYTFSQPK
jgi:uncharacterized protein YjiK